MNSTNTAETLNDFFDHYANALEQHDSKTLALLHFIPCTMLSDDAYTLFSDASKLEGFFNQGLLFYKQFGITQVRANIWSKAALTEKISRVKVNWQYFDASGKPVYYCDYHYIMKTDKYLRWKIMLSVSVNERERMEQWREQQTAK